MARLTQECEPHAVALSADGRSLAFGGGISYHPRYARLRTTHVVLVDLPGGTLRALGQGHAFVVRALAFSPDGAQVVSFESDTSLFTRHEVMSWDACTGQRHVARRGIEHALGSSTGPPPLHGIPRVIVTDRHVVTAAGNALVRWRDPVKLGRKQVHLIDTTQAVSPTPRQDHILDFALSADGRFAVTAGATQRLARWDLDAPSTAPLATAHGMVFAPDSAPAQSAIAALEAIGDEPYRASTEPSQRCCCPWSVRGYAKRLSLRDATTLAARWSLDVEGNPQRIVVHGDELITAGTEGEHVVMGRHALSDGRLLERRVHPMPLPAEAENGCGMTHPSVLSLAAAAGLVATATRDAVRFFSLTA